MESKVEKRHLGDVLRKIVDEIPLPKSMTKAQQQRYDRYIFWMDEDASSDEWNEVYGFLDEIYHSYESLTDRQFQTLSEIWKGSKRAAVKTSPLKQEPANLNNLFASFRVKEESASTLGKQEELKATTLKEPTVATVSTVQTAVSKRAPGNWFAVGPEKEHHKTLAERYCSCVFKRQTSDSKSSYNPYAICSKSVYNTRGKKGPGSVHCHFVKEYLDNFSADQLRTWLLNQKDFDSSKTLGMKTDDEYRDAAARLLATRGALISRADQLAWQKNQLAQEE